MRFILLFLFFSKAVFSADYDCIIIGSSPFSLFEALYQSHSGKKVLILEEAAECGGAWKAIDVCGIPHADLGCHQIGHDANLKQFLETYAGCRIVSLDHPELPFTPSNSPTGFYFSQGCFELIDHLEKLIAATDIDLLLNHKAESIVIDKPNKSAAVKTKTGTFSAPKIIITPMTAIQIENSAYSSSSASKSKYYHLYLLVQDPTPPRFTYNGGSFATGISRIMNLTRFVGIANMGRQLLVFQTHGESYLGNGQAYLDALKTKGLIDSGAYILKEETRIYESSHFNQSILHQNNASEFFEVLNTSHIQSLSSYIGKWQQALKPYREVMPD